MKRIIAAAALICIALVFLLEPLGLAWMSDNGMSSPIDITSNVHKSYFESGDGTKDLIVDEDGEVISGPYEIKYPLQLYYFAWLQYLGYFNTPKLDENGNEMKDENGNVITDTVYFRLSSDLDMDTIGDENVPDDEEYKYVLPPVGTLTNPFLGNFDGAGFTIKDLTVENVKDNLTERPNNTDKFGDAKEVEIVGFFGVVGQLAEGDYSYDTQANEVKNLVLENLTVTTLTDNALIGLVAGYVNGLVNYVGVVNSTVNIKTNTSILDSEKYTANLSNYSLIGYCTEKFKDSVYVMDVMLTNPTAPDKPYNVIPEIGGDGDNTGWGGSVKMLDIFTWLSAIRDSNSVSSTNGSYITNRTDVVSLNGTHRTISTSTGSKRTATVENFGSFIYTTLGDAYNFMSGATKVTEYKYAYTDENADLYYITDGTNYLSFNGSRITNETNPDNATKWYITNGVNGGIISTVYNGDLYYLTVDNGTITTISTVGVTPPTNIPSWSKSDNTYSCNGTPIACYDGTWQQYIPPTEGGYKISLNYNGTIYYLNNNSTTAVQRGTDENGANVWNIQAVNGGYTVSTIIDGNTYYLNYPTTLSGTGRHALSLSQTEQDVWQFSGNQLYVVQNNGTYYLRYSNSENNFVIQNRTNYNTIILTEVEASLPDEDEDIEVNLVDSGEDAKTVSVPNTPTTYIDNSLENYSYNSNGQKVVNDEAGITYFPLSSTVNVSQSSYEISKNNTGYVVSAQWGDVAKGESDSYGNVRISRYAADSMTNYTTPWTMTYKTGGKFKTITKQNTNQTTFTDADKATLASLGLMKYADCYADYRSSITNYCYGLHFMTASVSLSNMTRITAYLKGEKKENYQVPTNCIDFNLYDRGFINFVAGSYYTAQTPNNDSFFSIYEITRDPNDETTIIDIKEINKIYAKKNSNGDIDTTRAYYYTYTEGGNEVGLEGKPEGYEVVFNCRWITHPNDSSYYGAGGNNPSAWSNNRAFYFEVPVNAGEYAIGSTDGRTGAYLTYLDLAANAQLIEREKQYEEITETQSGATVPNGVELLEKPGSGESYDKDGDGKVDVNPADSSFVSINGGASGSILFEKTDENTITHTANDKTSAEYIGVGNTLMNGTTQEELPQSVQKVTKIERTTYRDYNLVTGDYTVTIITKTTVTYEDGTSEVKYTKQVTTTDSSGNLVADKTYPAKEVPEKEAVPDTKDEVVLTAGANLLNLGFAYGQEVELTISYEYVPAEKDENGNITAQPIYRITIVNPGEDDVIIKAMLTEAGKNSNITFVIVDGNGNVIATLDKTTDIQSITVDGTKATTEGGTEGGEGTDTPENGEGTEGGEDPAA